MARVKSDPDLKYTGGWRHFGTPNEIVDLDPKSMVSDGSNCIQRHLRSIFALPDRSLDGRCDMAIHLTDSYRRRKPISGHGRYIEHGRLQDHIEADSTGIKPV